jgi:hypothetical protein
MNSRRKLASAHRIHIPFYGELEWMATATTSISHVIYGSTQVMKKVFNIKVPKKTPERQADAIKRDVNKYVARERKKDIADKGDFWAFSCKIGLNAEEAKVTHVDDLSAGIDLAVVAEQDSVYIEIMAEAQFRTKKD